MNRNISVMVLRALPCAVTLVLLSMVCSCPVHAYDGSASAKVLVSGLQGPAGMAAHPLTGDIYVAEKKGGQISVIRGGSASPVITTNWTMDRKQIPLWMISREMTKESLSQTQLNAPSGVAVATNGTLYVCEGIPGGRLIEFVPDAEGAYSAGQIIPVPWIDRPFTWTDLKMTRDGRLYITGSVREADVLHFGSVLMRDVKGDWWVLDFGPFMNYNNICLTRGEDIVVISERDRGGLAWWDGVRRVPLGTRDESGSNMSADAIALLANGAFVQGQNTAAGGAKVMQIPSVGEPAVLVGGLDKVGGLLLVTNNLYIADEGKGVIVEAIAPVAGGYLLQRTLGEINENAGFKPRQTKKFLEQVLKQDPQQATVATDRMAMSLSLGEDVRNIAMIAGKIVANTPGEAQGVISDDPLARVDFVIFFPGRSIDSGDLATPSLTYFSATRKSGKNEQSRELFTGLSISERKSVTNWVDGGNTGRLLVPVSSVGVDKDESGVNINLAFLGLGIYSDYYLRLNSGQQNTGEIVVEALDGTREIYLAAFTDMATATAAEEADQGELMMVSMDATQYESSMGWLNIGKNPVNTALGVGTTEMHEFRSMDYKVNMMIQKKDREIELNRPRETVKEAAPTAVTPEAAPAQPAAAEGPQP